MKLIKIDRYWIVVENKRIENPKTTDIILDEYNQISNFVDLSYLMLGCGNMKKLIASQNPDHKLSNIRFSEEIAKELGEVDVEEISKTIATRQLTRSTDAWELYSRGALEGYNQCKEDNKEKKYTEADMRNCWLDGWQQDQNERNNLKQSNFDNYIQSLNKQEYEVEIQTNSNSITILKIIK